jgi:hypothetical protein
MLRMHILHRCQHVACCVLHGACLRGASLRRMLRGACCACCMLHVAGVLRVACCMLRVACNGVWHMLHACYMLHMLHVMLHVYLALVLSVANMSHNPVLQARHQPLLLVIVYARRSSVTCRKWHDIIVQLHKMLSRGLLSPRSLKVPSRAHPQTKYRLCSAHNEPCRERLLG